VVRVRKGEEGREPMCWIFLLSLLFWAKEYDEEQSLGISKQGNGIGKGVWTVYIVVVG